MFRGGLFLFMPFYWCNLEIVPFDTLLVPISTAFLLSISHPTDVVAPLGAEVTTIRPFPSTVYVAANGTSDCRQLVLQGGALLWSYMKPRLVVAGVAVKDPTLTSESIVAGWSAPKMYKPENVVASKPPTGAV
jgi:hypothetical protein